MSSLKYWVPECYEHEEDARELTGAMAEVYYMGEDYWNNGGWEVSWPLEFHYRVDAGPEMCVKISMEMSPLFSEGVSSEVVA